MRDKATQSGGPTVGTVLAREAQRTCSYIPPTTDAKKGHDGLPHPTDEPWSANTCFLADRLTDARYQFTAAPLDRT